MLKSYTNADWIGSVYDQKSTSGGEFFIRDILVSWFNKKHDLVSLSTIEVEYIAETSCCAQVIRMR